MRAKTHWLKVGTCGAGVLASLLFAWFYGSAAGRNPAQGYTVAVTGGFLLLWLLLFVWIRNDRTSLRLAAGYWVFLVLCLLVGGVFANGIQYASMEEAQAWYQPYSFIERQNAVWEGVDWLFQLFFRYLPWNILLRFFPRLSLYLPWMLELVMGTVVWGIAFFMVGWLFVRLNRMRAVPRRGCGAFWAACFLTLRLQSWVCGNQWTGYVMESHWTDFICALLATGVWLLLILFRKQVNWRFLLRGAALWAAISGGTLLHGASALYVEQGIGGSLSGQLLTFLLGFPLYVGTARFPVGLALSCLLGTALWAAGWRQRRKETCPEGDNRTIGPSFWLVLLGIYGEMVLLAVMWLVWRGNIPCLLAAAVSAAVGAADLAWLRRGGGQGIPVKAAVLCLAVLVIAGAFVADLL